MSSNPGRSNTGHRVARLVAAACALTLSATACAHPNSGTPGTAEGLSSPGTGGIAPVPGSPGTGTASGATAGGATGGGTGRAGGGTGRAGGGTGSTPTPTRKPPSRSPSAAPGPRIVSFTISGNASCAESGPGFSAPGTVTLTWKVTGTGTITVALSIDDPGFFGQHGTGSFGTYPAQDTQTLPFSCGAATSRTTHQYTLDTIGGGAHRTMTIKASATSHA